MDFIDRTLEETPFSSKHILNFLHNGPPEHRLPHMPDFDWRDVFNLTDRVIRMLNQYGEVSVSAFSGVFFFLPFFCDAQMHSTGRPTACTTVELTWQQKGRPTFPHQNKVSGLLLQAFPTFPEGMLVLPFISPRRSDSRTGLFNK